MRVIGHSRARIFFLSIEIIDAAQRARRNTAAAHSTTHKQRRWRWLRKCDHHRGPCAKKLLSPLLIMFVRCRCRPPTSSSSPSCKVRADCMRTHKVIYQSNMCAHERRHPVGAGGGVCNDEFRPLTAHIMHHTPRQHRFEYTSWRMASTRIVRTALPAAHFTVIELHFCCRTHAHIR